MASGAVDIGRAVDIRTEHCSAISALRAAWITTPRAAGRSIEHVTWNIGKLSFAGGVRFVLTQSVRH